VPVIFGRFTLDFESRNELESSNSLKKNEADLCVDRFRLNETED
jgi:hypothetical protein